MEDLQTVETSDKRGTNSIDLPPSEWYLAQQLPHLIHNISDFTSRSALPVVVAELLASGVPLPPAATLAPSEVSGKRAEDVVQRARHPQVNSYSLG